MSKFWKISAIIAVVVVVGGLIVGAVAFAQGPRNADGAFSPRNFASMRGHMDGQSEHSMRGGQKGGQMDHQMDGMMSEDMEATMHAAIADALGMTEADFETAMDSGKTMFDIATEQGVDVDTVMTAMQEAHATAIQSAVDAGTMTQEQADWMAQRGSMHGNMDGDMQSHGQMGGHGAHGERGEHNGDCTYNNDADTDAN